jgi:predicted Zn-dependent protease
VSRFPSSIALSALISTVCFIGSNSVTASENWRNRASAEEAAVTQSDIAAEITFGRAIAARILGRYPIYDNPKLIKYINLLGVTLAQNTNRPELEFHLMILNTDEINAYAAPGGYVFITKGALAQMKDESELAGVLGHEIAHIAEKHIVRDLKIKGSDESGTNDLARLIGGSSESARAAFGQAVDKGLELIVKDDYKKEDELQADKTGITISALSGYDPAGLARYLTRIKPLKEKTPAANTENTHPTFDSRTAQINEIINKEALINSAQTKNSKRFAENLKALQ